MTRSFIFLTNILLVSLPVLIHAFTEPNGLTCKEHPAYSSSLKPVIVRSWYMYTANFAQQPAYFPRFRNMTFAPVSDTSSNKYKGLDYFFTGDITKNPSYRMYFQRKAKVHMIVPIKNDKTNFKETISFPGWKSEGWIKRVEGSSTLTYGIHQRKKFPISTHWYMFSKSTTTKGGEHYADMPMNLFVKQQLKKYGVAGNFDLLISEADGSPSKEVGNFKGKKIRPNTRCPDALHNMWKATEKDDPDVRGMKFDTWHPAWDPCFWW